MLINNHSEPLFNLKSDKNKTYFYNYDEYFEIEIQFILKSKVFENEIKLWNNFIEPLLQNTF